MADDVEPPRVVRAAGGVLWRRGGDGVEVAVVHRPRYDDWSLPKGKPLPGEHLVRCAVREALEETGIRVVLGRPLGEVAYEVGGVPKSVRHWVLTPVDGTGFRPNDEVDELRWLPVARARAALSYPHEAAPLDAFAAGPAETTTVLLVRHAYAGSSEAWDADDDARPLDPVGLDQAAALAAFGSCFGVRRVVSARPVRCVDTVRPLAAEVGAAVEVDPAYGDAGYWREPTAVADRVRALGAAGVPVAVCSQGGPLPDLVARLADADGVAVPDPVPARKGSAWALSFAGRTLVAADYHPRLAG